MKTYARIAALLAALSMAGPALADSITCESKGGRENYCRTNTNGGVYLQTQLSGNGCYQGETWGYDNNGIWVNSGCRAVFRTGGWSNYNTYHNNGYNYNNGYNNNYNNNNHHNDSGAGAAVAIGAILGAVVIASAASANSKKSSSSGQQYQDYYKSGCDAGVGDRKKGKSMDHTRHAGAYSGSTEQAYTSGYNKCWAD
jgi:hypothetical protein